MDLSLRESPVSSTSKPKVKRNRKHEPPKFTPSQVENLEKAFRIDEKLCEKNERMLDGIGLTTLQVGTWKPYLFNLHFFEYVV